MKATRLTPPPPPFVPVVLTLETQEEVNALYALIVNDISNAVGLNEKWEVLEPFYNAEQTQPLRDSLHKEIARRRTML